MWSIVGVGWHRRALVIVEKAEISFMEGRSILPGTHHHHFEVRIKEGTESSFISLCLRGISACIQYSLEECLRQHNDQSLRMETPFALNITVNFSSQFGIKISVMKYCNKF